MVGSEPLTRVEPKIDMSATANSSLPWRATWLQDFCAAFVVLLALKLGLTAYLVWGADSFDSAWLAYLKLPLFMGSDILGGALTASLILALRAPLGLLGRGRAAAGLALGFQMVLGVVMAASVFTLVYVGGLVNKQSLDLALVGSDEDLADRIPALWASFRMFLTPSTLTGLAGAGLLAAAAWRVAPRALARVPSRVARGLGIVAVVSTLFTLALLPRLMSGEWGGIRIYAAGLEKSPGVELAWSYLRAALPRGGPSRGDVGGDPFRIDLAARHAQDGPPPLQGARPKRTNVLIVMMESIGEPYLAEDPARMPTLDALGRRPGGVRFRSHYATWSLTTKVLFSVLCSEHPFPTYKPITLVNPGIPCRSLSQILYGQGYRTTFLTSQSLAYDEQPRFLDHHAFDDLIDSRTMEGREGAWFGKWGIDDHVSARALLRWIDLGGARPFFALYGMVAGHHPFVASPEQEAQPAGERVAEYYRALRVADDVLAELVAGLEARGLMDDTLLLVFSDHGEGHGRHAGRNVYESVIKVPLLALGPQLRGVAPEARVVTSHLDLAPTVLGLLGLPVPCTMKGRDLSSSGEARVAFSGGRPPRQQYGLVDGRWKYILEDGLIEHLYDRLADPEERIDRVDDHPEVARAFKARVEGWMAHSRRLIEDYTSLSSSACAGAAGAPASRLNTARSPRPNN
jgi:arylsulfatase A-like enzyme